MYKNLLLLVAKTIHSIFDKKEIDRVEFLVKGYWEIEQWKKRDLILSQGYVVVEHSWGEFDNYDKYVYSK